MIRTVWSAPVNDPASCPHARTELIAKDSEAEYVLCVDCGAILEAGERAGRTSGTPDKSSDESVNESLSDA